MAAREQRPARDSKRALVDDFVVPELGRAIPEACTMSPESGMTGVGIDHGTASFVVVSFSGVGTRLCEGTPLTSRDGDARPLQGYTSDKAASTASSQSGRSANSGINEPPIVIIGAGLTGMALALMLAKRSLPVLVFERDPRDAFGPSGEHPAQRIGAPHANRPHSLLAGGRDVLLRSPPKWPAKSTSSGHATLQHGRGHRRHQT